MQRAINGPINSHCHFYIDSDADTRHTNTTKNENIFILDDFVVESHERSIVFRSVFLINIPKPQIIFISM